MANEAVEALKDRLLAAADSVAPDLEVEFKAMFGGACAYVRGRVFASLSNVGLALKLPPEAQEELLKQAGAKRLQYSEEDPPSRQYIVVPPVTLERLESLAEWVRRSVEHVMKLPGKVRGER